MRDEVWPEFACEYTFEGKQYGLAITAKDWSEASRRLRAIGTTAQIKGELMEVIPAVPGAGLYVRLRVFFANLFALGRQE